MTYAYSYIFYSILTIKLRIVSHFSLSHCGKKEKEKPKNNYK
jgi:hypothetical protein